jgi:hypothetical protein
MPAQQEEALALRISAMLLLKNRELYLDDIKSLPFLSSDFDISKIVNRLIHLYDAKMEQERISTEPYLSWADKLYIEM